MKTIITATLLLFCLNASSATITIKINSLIKDNIIVNLIQDEAVDNKKSITVKAMNGKFSFSNIVDRPCVVRIFDGKNIVYGIVDNTDDVSIEYDSTDIKTTFIARGKGAIKFFPDKKAEINTRISVITKGASSSLIDEYFKKINFLEKSLLDSLLSFIPGNNDAGKMIRGYYTSIFNYAKRRLITRIYPDVPLTVIKDSLDNTSSYLKDQIKEILSFENELCLSPDYINDVYYCLLQEYMSLTLSQRTSGTTPDKYRFYTHYLPDQDLRERVLCLLLSTDFISLNDTDYLVQLTKNEIKKASTPYSAYFDDLIRRYGSLFRKGEPAPEFSLTGISGNEIHLSDFRGKVVVLDFWYRGCVPCIAFFNSVKSLKEEFNNSNVVFLNISIDSKETWLKAVEKLNIGGVHSYTQGKQAAHPIINAYQISGYPTVCILDKQGRFFNASPPVGNMIEFRNQVKMALEVQ